MQILANVNAVLVANTFNPSVFSPAWLVKHGFADEGDLMPDFVFTPVRAQFSTREVAYLIVPMRAEISAVLRHAAEPPGITVDTADAIDQLESKVRLLTDTLPHTPYTGLGFNFAWVVPPHDREESRALLNRIFFKPDNAFMNEIAKTEFTMGGFVLQKWQEGTLKIEVKPTRYALVEGEPNQEGVLVDFNFHFACEAGEHEAMLQKALAAWKDAASHATVLVNSLATS